MNDLIQGFKACAARTGVFLSIPNGRLIREFGLEDFMENSIHEDDDAPTIAVKALSYFCEGATPEQPIFRFATLTVGLFLNRYHANGKGEFPQVALSDLVQLLGESATEQQLRAWIDSHFG